MSRKRSRRSTREISSDTEPDTYGLADDNDKSRPYYIVEDLPCSLDTPRYDTFTHPLSVKDSAVLYSSLLNSRRTWIKGEMFQLHWAKQYINTKEKEELKKEGIDPESIDQSAAREKMNKLCDSTMQGGPHQFPIRLFILKNDDVEKAWNNAKEAKKIERRERRKQQEEEKQQKRERKRLQRQLKQEALEKEKEKNKDKVRKPRKPYKKSAKKADTEKKPKAEPKSETKQKPSDSKLDKKTKKTKTVLRAKPYEEQVMILNLNKMARNDKKLNDLMIKVAGGQANVNEITEFKKYIEKAKSMPPPSGTWKPMLEEVEVTDDEESDKENELILNKNGDKKKVQDSSRDGKKDGGKNKHENKDVAKVESQEKSANNDNDDNNIKKEPSDSASSISTEQSTVEATPTGPSEHTSDNQPHDAKTDDQGIEDEDEDNDDDDDDDEDDDEDEDEDGNGNISSNTKSDEEDDDNDDNDEKVNTISKADTDKSDTSTGDSKGNPPVTKRKYKKRLKVKTEEEEEEERAMQLTTFQQKYSNGADLVFEYVENPNVRFLLPKFSMIEQLEDEESYLLSFIVIHNRREVALFKSRKLKELNKKKKIEEQIKEEEYNPFADARCPTPLFSTVTIKLSEIPKKFANIMLNSFFPQEKVQDYMNSIITRGDRLSGYNLWYQLDAYDDKDLAESLRVGLKEYEQNFKSKRQKKQII